MPLLQFFCLDGISLTVPSVSSMLSKLRHLLEAILAIQPGNLATLLRVANSQNALIKVSKILEHNSKGYTIQILMILFSQAISEARIAITLSPFLTTRVSLAFIRACSKSASGESNSIAEIGVTFQVNFN